MKRTKIGYMLVEPDHSEFLPSANRYSTNFSERTIETMARGCTVAQWARQCEQGLSMVNDAGELVTGQAIFDLYKQFCRED